MYDRHATILRELGIVTEDRTGELRQRADGQMCFVCFVSALGTPVCFLHSWWRTAGPLGRFRLLCTWLLCICHTLFLVVILCIFFICFGMWVVP